MGLRELLDVDEAVGERIVVALHGADPQHMQDYLGVLRIVLVPTVGQRLPRPGKRERGDQSHVDAGLEQPVRQRPMVLPCHLEPVLRRLLEGAEHGHQPIMLVAGVQDGHPASEGVARRFDQNLGVC